MHARYATKGLQIVGVSLDEEATAGVIREFAEKHEMKYQIWRDPGQKFSTQFQFAGLPMTVLIDKTGVIRWLHRGRLPPRDTTLDAAIRNALVM